MWSHLSKTAGGKLYATTYRWEAREEGGWWVIIGTWDSRQLAWTFRTEHERDAWLKREYAK